MSAGYWLKPAKRTSAPTSLASVVVQTRPLGDTSRSGRTALGFLRAAVATAAFRGGRWGSRSAAVLHSGAELHDWLEEWARPRAGNWVVSPQAGASLFVSGWFSRLVERGCEWVGAGGFAPEGTTPARPGRQSASCGPQPLRDAAGPHSTASDTYSISKLVLGSRVNIARYSTRGKSLTWVSGQQFFPAGEESLAETFGYEWRDGIGTVPVGSVVLRDPAARAGLWLTAFTELCDWWRRVDGGPFGPTPGSLALSFVRRRLVPRTVLSHQIPAVRALEERGLFGGDARVWFYGDVVRPRPGGGGDDRRPGGPPHPPARGPVELWDVRSMYPTILRHEKFPVRLLNQWRTPTVRELSEMLDVWGVIASVRLKTEVSEYPYRNGDRIEHPKGEFDTCLCGPELKRAVDEGAVAACHFAATYQLGQPFAGAFGELLEERERARREARPVWEVFVKLLSNSFGGKLAQKKTGWERLPGVCPERDWGEWTERNATTGGRVRFRSIAGLLQKSVAVAHNGRPLASVFCYLTSHGRSLMRLIREALPPRTVVSQDTDGIWVLAPTEQMYQTAAAVARSRGYDLARKGESRSDNGIWYGPRHYWTDAGWVLAGFHEHRQWGDGLTFDDSYTFLPVGGTGTKPPEWVYHCNRRTRLGSIPADGVVGEDGWTVPRRLFPVKS